MKAPERQALPRALQTRCEKNMHRLTGIAWADVQTRLEAQPAALSTLHSRETTGGEPDVIGQDNASARLTFRDCSPESPAGRGSLCNDGEALDARKQNKPGGSAVQVAAAMGVELLTEPRYGELQKLGDFDAKTSSWVKTPPEVRALGGALFCDRRYGKVFAPHKGAKSYCVDVDRPGGVRSQVRTSTPGPWIDWGFRLLAFGLPVLLQACMVLPRTTQVFDPECQVVSNHMVLETVQVAAIHQCANQGCVALVVGAVVVSAASVVISGSIVVAGNVAYWLEKQAQCRGEPK